MTAPINKLDWWKQDEPLPSDRPLLRDPARLLFVAGAALLALGALLPWASGLDPVGQPASYRATEGTAEGVTFLASALLLVFLARDGGIWELTSRTRQLLPLFIALFNIPMWIGANHYSLMVIDEWQRLGGSGSQTVMPFVTAAGIAAVILGWLFFERMRPPEIRARTAPLLVEWGLTRWGTAAIGAALVLGMAGAAAGIILPALFLGAQSMALGVFLAVFGLFIGIGLGVFVATRLRAFSERNRGVAPRDGSGRRV